MTWITFWLKWWNTRDRNKNRSGTETEQFIIPGNAILSVPHAPAATAGIKSKNSNSGNQELTGQAFGHGVGSDL
jgi:hypothetical protein